MEIIQHCGIISDIFISDISEDVQSDLYVVFF